MTECIASLVSDITKYSTEAEANRDFTLLTQAIFFFGKENGIKALDVALGKLENDIKVLGE